MIRRINISNYALIRSLTVEPSSGFNIITGETGAGKSIILGALALLQGRRADSRVSGNGKDKTVIEAEVVMDDGNVRTLRREILPAGRSRAFIDGRQVSVAELTEAAAQLIDIHSQNQNVLLADPGFQLSVIDHLAQNSALLAGYRKAYAEYRVALQNFARSRDEIDKTRTDADFLEFQLNEFKGIELVSGEDDDLENDRERLIHSADIFSSLSSAAGLISNADDSAVEKLQVALYSLKDAARLSEKYSLLVDRIESLKNELEALGEEAADLASDINSDPAALEEIEQKLRRINALKSRHRVGSVAELIEIRDSVAQRMDALQNSETILHDLEQTARRLKKKALEIASQISARRRQAAEMLVAELTARGRPLGMENLVVEIDVSSGKLNPDGIDTVEFRFAFNKNQTPVPVINRASGGEMSRVMLALKSITVEHSHTPTVIFDEIDTGVSGDVANRMARLMALIAEHIQVIAISHLPQVAALGDKHFKVYKRDDETSTQTFISELDSDGRRREIALMLSGNAADSASLAAADSLLAKK